MDRIVLEASMTREGKGLQEISGTFFTLYKDYTSSGRLSDQSCLHSQLVQKSRTQTVSTFPLRLITMRRVCWGGVVSCGVFLWKEPISQHDYAAERVCWTRRFLSAPDPAIHGDRRSELHRVPLQLALTGARCSRSLCHPRWAALYYSWALYVDEKPARTEASERMPVMQWNRQRPLEQVERDVLSEDFEKCLLVSSYREASVSGILDVVLQDALMRLKLSETLDPSIEKNIELVKSQAKKLTTMTNEKNPIEITWSRQGVLLFAHSGEIFAEVTDKYLAWAIFDGFVGIAANVPKIQREELPICWNFFKETGSYHPFSNELH